MIEREAKELKREIGRIKERNKRVELDKAWETSWQRKILIFILTYIVILIFFIFAQLPNPLVNSIVPAIAFVLSTLTLSFCQEPPITDGWHDNATLRVVLEHAQNSTSGSNHSLQTSGILTFKEMWLKFKKTKK